MRPRGVARGDFELTQEISNQPKDQGRFPPHLSTFTAGMTVQQVVDLDLSYAPPFSPVWDPVQTAARQLLAAGR